MTDNLVTRLELLAICTDYHAAELNEAVSRIKILEAALRTIDNAIPKNDLSLPATCLIAGDIAEGVLNGTWPAFGVMPRAALEGKK